MATSSGSLRKSGGTLTVSSSSLRQNMFADFFEKLRKITLSLEIQRIWRLDLLNSNSLRRCWKLNINPSSYNWGEDDQVSMHVSKLSNGLFSWPNKFTKLKVNTQKTKGFDSWGDDFSFQTYMFDSIKSKVICLVSLQKKTVASQLQCIIKAKAYNQRQD